MSKVFDQLKLIAKDELKDYDTIRETPTFGHQNSIESENDGLRQTCRDLIEALEIMCSSFPAPEKVKEIRKRFEYLKER
jgi:hypothetical protein